jgi:hypothetical protein
MRSSHTNRDAGFRDATLIVEGEFNQLQLQSLGARIAELEGASPETGYFDALAVGGVQNADCETIRRVAVHPAVCYDNDENSAGYGLVERLRDLMAVDAFTTPGPDSDLDSFLRSFDDDRAGYSAVLELFGARKREKRTRSGVRSEIDAIRRNALDPKLKQFEVHRAVADAVIGDMLDRGKLLHEGDLRYVFLEDEKKLMPIEPDDSSLEIELSHYGLNPTEHVTKYVFEEMRIAAVERGEAASVYAFRHYDPTTGVLYVHNLDDKVFRISPNGTTIVENGTDGVLFVCSQRVEPFDATLPLRRGSALFEEIIEPISFEEDVLSTDDQRRLLRLSILSIFFPELFPTKVILALIGPQGSGKSIVLKKIGQLLLGPSFNVMPLSRDPKDFDAAVTHDFFAAIDNADTPSPWLEDRLATAATGGTIKLRELYTTNRMVEYPIRAALAITSRSPNFRRPDIADRLLPLYVKRFGEFIAEAKLLSHLQARRSEMMGQLLAELEHVVRVLAQQRDVTYRGAFRMADFAEFGYKIATAEEWADEFIRMMERLSKQQASFALAEETVVDLIEAWLQVDGGKNAGRAVKSSELFGELTLIAQSKKIEFILKPGAFAQKLAGLVPTLQECFDIEVLAGRSRQRFYKFWPLGGRVERNEEW